MTKKSFRVFTTVVTPVGSFSGYASMSVPSIEAALQLRDEIEHGIELGQGALRLLGGQLEPGESRQTVDIIEGERHGDDLGGRAAAPVWGPVWVPCWTRL